MCSSSLHKTYKYTHVSYIDMYYVQPDLEKRENNIDGETLKDSYFKENINKFFSMF